jgi:hypothetical protein
MIVWGGYVVANTGGRHSSATNSWTTTRAINAPDARVLHTGVWTGTERIIWGGIGGFGVLNNGGKCDLGTDSWTATSIPNAPDARQYHTAYGPVMKGSSGAETTIISALLTLAANIARNLFQHQHLVLLRHRRHVRADADQHRRHVRVRVFARLRARVRS